MRISDWSSDVCSSDLVAWERAEEILAAEDLVAMRADEASDTVAAGNVIRTDPEQGVSVGRGEEVTVYVSRGEETAAVPILTGVPEESARQLLTDAGLRSEEHTSESQSLMLISYADFY